jgi:hypothetical protein
METSQISCRPTCYFLDVIMHVYYYIILLLNILINYYELYLISITLTYKK